jgi:FkbM family methyltransferase
LLFKKLNSIFKQHKPIEVHVEWATLSYSQEGEDIILDNVFEGKRNGLFVDVGAHHPHRFSNTFFFYKLGWRGINIDAMPGSMDAFRRYRPDDINLEIGVSQTNGRLTYYMFNEPALNGFDKELATSRNGLRDYRIVETKQIPTRQLSSILDEYLPNGQKIDFLNVDVEGLDLDVLQSNDWSRFRPTIVIAESLPHLPLTQIKEDPIYIFMCKNRYRIIAKTMRDMLFQEITGSCA